MAVRPRRAVSLAALMLALAAAAPAQTAIRGAVVDSETGGPLEGALVTARSAARAAVTDRVGRFVLWIARLPDTLRIALIGRSPARLPLAEVPPQPLLIRLQTQPIMLAEVIVTAPAGTARPLEDVGRWQVPVATARDVPPAIETDVLRSLSLVPAVTFSTPLSSRPLVRGYDAGESSVRIDGFEVFNLYHIGRIFSAFPADAASQVDVAAAPHSAATGGTLAGTVDITGRTGEPDRTGGGADISLASVTTWLGAGSPAVQWFGAVRAVHLALLDVASGHDFPYDFQDVYTNAMLARDGRPAAKITAFASRDHLFDRDLGSGMDWSNLLVAGRWQAAEGGRGSMSVWASGNRFAEDVADVPARYSRIDVRNRFERVAAGADAKLQGARSRLAWGVSLGRRAIGNRITPRGGDDFAATDATFRLVEFGAYAEGTATAGRTSFMAGVRLDAAGGNHILQPRARLAVPLGAGVSLGLGLGRTGRLYHLVSDPQSEPELAFYDFWLNAAERGVPIPIVDHGTIDMDVQRGPVAARASLFVSRGRGLVDLRPVTDQSVDVAGPFRYGRSRSGGVEIQVGVRGSGSDEGALSATYVLSYSQRNWGGGWVAWSQDRRHLLRVIARARLSTRWSVSSVVEALSGPPLTPVDGVLIVAVPDTGGGGLARDLGGSPAYIYGPENSARSSGTARADIAVRYVFSGPRHSRMTLGLSVVNVGFGPVAPLRAAAPNFDPGLGLQGRVRYERLFDLPAVPSVALRVEF